MREPAKAETYLKSIDSGIGSGETGVGDVHEADFGAPVIFVAKNMHAKSRAGREV